MKKTIMKKTIYVGALLISALGMTSCSSDSEQTARNEAPVAINLTATAGSIDITTRAASTEGNSLAQNSEIAVAMPLSSNTSKMTYTNSAAALSSTQSALTLKTGNTTPYFLSANPTVHIYAAYPASAMTNNNGTVTMTVAEDQSSNYDTSDLLYAKSSAEKATQATVTANLAFYHMMPKIIVNVTNSTGAEITSIKLKNVCKTLTITPTSTYAFDAEATAFTYYSGKGFAATAAGDVVVGTASGQCALIAPQTVAASTDLIEIVTNQGTATFKLGENAKDFLPGKVYTAAITVSGTSIGLTGTINDWTTADNTDLGTKYLN